jgi:hypothetical protein
VLGQPHAVADDRRGGADVDIGDPADLILGHARGLDDRVPAFGHHIGAHRLDPGGMLVDEGLIEHRLARRGAFEHDLHHALEQRQIAADPDMDEFAGDIGRSEGRHLDHVLRLCELDQRAFGHRVDGDDRDAAFARLNQIGHHAGRVRSGVLPDDEDRLGLLEILQHHGALADADGGRQAAAGGFVAHVGAIGKIVGPKFAHEDRIKERRLVRGAAGGVVRRPCISSQ